MSQKKKVEKPKTELYDLEDKSPRNLELPDRSRLNKLMKLEDRSRRNNLKIDDIEEQEGETWQISEVETTEIFKEKLIE